MVLLGVFLALVAATALLFLGSRRHRGGAVLTLIVCAGTFAVARVIAQGPPPSAAVSSAVIPAAAIPSAAVPTAPVAAATPAPPAPPSEASTRAATCLATATKLAHAVGAVTGRQTSTQINLEAPGITDVTYGCARFYGPDDVFAAWHGSPRPPAPQRAFVARLGAALTGLPQQRLLGMIARGVTAALKPDAGEDAQVEEGGVAVSCHAFKRDGGGGSISISRLEGQTPPAMVLTEAEIEAARPTAEAALR